MLAQVEQDHHRWLLRVREWGGGEHSVHGVLGIRLKRKATSGCKGKKGRPPDTVA
jgi:hypothetical protein